MRATWLLVVCVLAGCVPDFDPFTIVDGAAGSDGGSDGTTGDLGQAGSSCKPASLTQTVCSKSHFLLASATGDDGVIIDRPSTFDGTSCDRITLPTGRDPARGLTVTPAGGVAVMIGDSVALAEGGSLSCLASAGETPVDVFQFGDKLAIAWKQRGATTISHIELHGSGDLSSAAVQKLVRVTASPFKPTELVGTSVDSGPDAAITLDPSSGVNGPSYGFGANVRLTHVAAYGGRVAWAGVDATQSQAFHIGGRADSTPLAQVCGGCTIDTVVPSNQYTQYLLRCTDGKLMMLDAGNATCSSYSDGPIQAISVGGS